VVGREVSRPSRPRAHHGAEVELMEYGGQVLEWLRTLGPGILIGVLVLIALILERMARQKSSDDGK